MTAGYEVLPIMRDAMGLSTEVSCEIETSDLEFLRIGRADVGLATERVGHGLVLSLARTKIYQRSSGTRIEIRRRRGTVKTARIVISPGDLGFIDADAEAVEKTTTRVAGELIVRFTAKKGSEGMGP